jgi:hypothetical protein
MSSRTRGQYLISGTNAEARHVRSIWRLPTAWMTVAHKEAFVNPAFICHTR